MNFGMLFDYLWDIVHDSEQCRVFQDICTEKGIPTLYSKTIYNIKKMFAHICSECVVAVYHEMKGEGKLTGATREERTQFFCETYLSDKHFAQFFLNKYPIIKDAITITAHDYINLCTNIVIGYYGNADAIEDAFGHNLGQVNEIALPAGDLHNGKAVSIVTFDAGKLVYKPRDLKTDRIFENVVSLIAGNIPTMPTFCFPKGLEQENYSWQEFMEHAPCANMEQVHRFYYRAGIYLAVFYLFSSCDMHYDNMISHGEYPIFFDVETLVTGKLGVDSLNAKEVSNSVLSTNMIPISLDSPALDVNMSALFTGKHQSKKVTQYTIEADNDLDWAFVKRYITIEGSNNKVLCCDHEVLASDVEGDLIAGFSDAMHVVVEQKKLIMDLVMSIDSNTKVRQVIRPTQVYARFISACRNPAYATDYSKTESILDILFQKFTPGNFGYLRVEREVADLKRGYIPSFYTKYGSTDLFSYSDNQIVCANYFHCTPRDVVLKKIKELDQNLIEYQTRLISMSLLMTCDVRELHGRTIYSSKTDKRSCLQLDENSITALLKEYADYISKNIIFYANNQCTMALPVIKENSFSIHSIDFGLYDSGGIIWLLALCGYYYDSSLDKYVTGFLNALISKYTTAKQMNSQPINYSLGNGMSGFLYVVFNVARLHNDQYLYGFCRTLVQDIFCFYADLPITWELFDYLGGLPGCIYLLCKLHLADSSIVPKEALENLGDRFLSRVLSADITSLEFGYAHGRVGLAVALAGMYEVTKNSNYLDGIKNVFPTNCDDVDSISWCRGQAGWLLASHLIAAHTGDIQYSSHAYRFGEEHMEQLLTCDNACLCHGVWGSVDVLNTLGLRAKLRDLTPLKVNFDSLVDLKFIESSKYCYEPFMTGISGVAYSLLRLIREVPSLLSLDIFTLDDSL